MPQSKDQHRTGGIQEQPQKEKQIRPFGVQQAIVIFIDVKYTQQYPGGINEIIKAEPFGQEFILYSPVED